MKRIRFQNRASASNVTLLAVSVLATLSWWLQGDFTLNYGIGYLCAAVIAFLLFVLNARFELIRYRSRMVASVFLMYLGAAPFLHPFQTGSIVALTVSMALYPMFSSYAQKWTMSSTFQLFAYLSLGSFFFPQLLYYAPLFLFATSLLLRTLSFRSLCAGLLGLIVPYWFWFGYQLVQDDLSPFLLHFDQLTQFTPVEWEGGLRIDVSGISLRQRLTFCALTWIALVATVRYVRTSFDDKTQVRMCYHVFILLEFATLLFMLLQPQHFDALFCLLVVVSSPLIAHFFAHTHRWVTNALFLLFLFQLLALTLYDLWMPLLIS